MNSAQDGTREHELELNALVNLRERKLNLVCADRPRSAGDDRRGRETTREEREKTGEGERRPESKTTLVRR